MSFDDEQRQVLLYDKIREHINHEDELSNKRITLYMTFQGLLFAAYGFIVSGRASAPAVVPPNIPNYLSILGIVSSGLVLIGYWAGSISQMFFIQMWYQSRMKDVADKLLPPLIAPNRIVWGGWIPWVTSPVSCAVAWWWLSSARFVNYWFFGTLIGAVIAFVVTCSTLAAKKPWPSE